MRIALRELLRRPGRFGAATAILTLIAILLMFLGGLLDGLTAGNTGALRAQQADLIVYSAASRDSLVRSRIDPALRTQVARTPGVQSAGGLGSVQLGARIGGKGPRDLVPVVLFGYDRAPRDLPSPAPRQGEVVADDALRGEGVTIGDTIRLGPARSPVRVTGFVTDTKFNGQAGIWGSLATWRAVLNANRPGARFGPGVVQALAVDVRGAPDDVARAIGEATNGATSALTTDRAIDAIPGVSAQRGTFNQIIGVTVVIAIVVVALFFALITIERMPLYGVLKAIGARSRTLLGGVLLQAITVTLVASAVGATAALALAAAIPAGGIPFVATPQRLLSSAAILLLAAVIGCAFSLRRVLRVDPATAIGGAP